MGGRWSLKNLLNTSKWYFITLPSIFQNGADRIVFCQQDVNILSKLFSPSSNETILGDLI